MRRQKSHANNLIQPYHASDTDYVHYEGTPQLVIRKDALIKSTDGIGRISTIEMNEFFEYEDIQNHFLRGSAKWYYREKHPYFKTLDAYKAEVRKRELLYRKRKHERFPNLKFEYY
jgi:hypothetical protein